MIRRKLKTRKFKPKNKIPQNSQNEIQKPHAPHRKKKKKKIIIIYFFFYFFFCF